jgi:hypothetical protein
MGSDFSNEDTDDDQMEYTNNINSGEESYYYMGVETKMRNECLMTEILEEKVTDMIFFFKKVTIQKGIQNPEVWAHQLENKFDKIGIRKVQDHFAVDTFNQPLVGFR